MSSTVRSLQVTRAMPVMLGVAISATLALGIEPLVGERLGIAYHVPWLVVNALLWHRILTNAPLYRYRLFVMALLSGSLFLVVGGEGLDRWGTYGPSVEALARSEGPACPLQAVQHLVAMPLHGSLAFPTRGAGVLFGGALFMLALIGIAGLTLGRAWCGWGCMLGAGFECLTRVTARSIVPTRAGGGAWRFLPLGVLVGAILGGVALFPLWCEWACPFRPLTDIHVLPGLDAGASLGERAHLALLLSLPVALLVVLPILTRKRTHCTYWCPLGAFHALAGRLGPYRLQIDASRCRRCLHCASVCPVNAVDVRRDGAPKVLEGCTRCELCVEGCPTKAIGTGMRGLPFGFGSGPDPGWRRWVSPRRLYLYAVGLLNSMVTLWLLVPATRRLVLLFASGTLGESP